MPPSLSRHLDTHAVGLSCFGPQAARMGLILDLMPALAPRIVLAPRRALHALAVAVEAGFDAGIGAAAVAGRVATTHPRTLFRAALPDAPAQLYRLLDRVALPAWPLADYRVLAQLLQCGLPPDAIADAMIGRQDVARIDQLLGEDPLLRRPLATIAACMRRGGTDELIVVLRTLRRYGVAVDRIFAGLPAKAGQPAIMSRLYRALAQLAAPPPAFPEPPGWRFLRTVGELFEAGRTLRNCLEADQHGLTLIKGMLVGETVLLIRDDGEALVELTPEPGGAWRIVQAARRCNFDLSAEEDAALADALRAVGVTLTSDNLYTALSTISMRRRWVDHFRDVRVVLEGAR